MFPQIKHRHEYSKTCACCRIYKERSAYGQSNHTQNTVSGLKECCLSCENEAEKLGISVVELKKINRNETK